MAQQVARRRQVIERVDEAWRRSLSRRSDRAGNGANASSGLDRGKEEWDRRLALALEDAVNRTRPVLDDGACSERGTVPANADKHPRKARFRRLREIDDLGDICQVIAGKCNDIWPPALKQAKIRAMILDLQIDEPDFVAGTSRRLRDELEPQRFEPQENPGVEQGAGMDT